MALQLDRAARLRLLRFVTGLAWIDGEVQEKEKDFVRKLLARLGVERDEAQLVEGWFDKPPHPAEIDPMKVPPDHRELLLQLAHEVAGADDHSAPAELECLQTLEEMFGGR